MASGCVEKIHLAQITQQPMEPQRPNCV